MTREHPILFSPAMVRAILDGRKSQHRLPMQPQPSKGVIEIVPAIDGLHWIERLRIADSFRGIETTMQGNSRPCPVGRIGDVLWVPETWRAAAISRSEGWRAIEYKADGAIGKRRVPLGYAASAFGYPYFGSWRSPAIMPKWASRLRLKVEAVRVERLQEISEEDYFAEGLRMPPIERTIDGGGGEMVDVNGWWRHEFRVEWDRLNGKRAPYSSNPCVWVVGFSGMEGA